MFKRELVFLISVLVFLPIVYATELPIKAEFSNSDIQVFLSNSTYTNLTIANTGKNDTNFILSLKGRHPESITFDNPILAAANSSITKKIIISPAAEIGRFDFTLYGESISDPSMNFSLPIKLWVRHPDRYIVTDFASSVEGSSATASITLIPDDRLQTEIEFNVFDISQKKVKSASISQETEKQSTLKQALDISDLSPGKYTLEAQIKGTQIKKTISFDVGLEKGLKQQKTITPGLFFDEVKISVYNNGNSIENGYKIYEEVGKNRPVRLVTNATDIIKSGDRLKYEFTIEKLRPGEVATIIYRLENWGTLLIAGAAGVIIIAAILFLVLAAKKPRIRKSAIKTGLGKYTITLEVINPKLAAIKNAIIRDFVQPSVKVNRYESSGTSPTMRDSQIGTEIFWKITEINKSQNLILGYTIDAKDGAPLKLSPARIEYVTSRNRKAVVLSNPVVLK